MFHFAIRNEANWQYRNFCNGEAAFLGLLKWTTPGGDSVDCPDCLNKGLSESRFSFPGKGSAAMSVDGSREYNGSTIQEQLEFERTLGEPMKKAAAEPTRKLVHMIDYRNKEREWTLCGSIDVIKSDNCLSVTCLYCLNGLKAHVESRVAKILDGGIKSALPVTKQEELIGHWEKCQKALEDFASVDKCSKEFRSFEDLCKQVEALEKKIDTLLSGFKQPAEVYVPPDARHPFFGGVVKLGEGTMYDPSLHGVIKNNSLNI